MKLMKKIMLMLSKDRIILQDGAKWKVKKCTSYKEGEILTIDNEIIAYSDVLEDRRNKIYLSNITELPILELNKARSIIESHLIKRLTREKLTIFEFILVAICIGSIVFSFFAWKEVSQLTALIRGV
ncbi:hypothetical protein R9X47_27140 [Wukongibacter baidiensis]|uniref:hypothetical protein n=1 Tax=Wukongibacter baidiensis TaxID=1723361 RepID=UPI003D7F9E65